MSNVEVSSPSPALGESFVRLDADVSIGGAIRRLLFAMSKDKFCIYCGDYSECRDHFVPSSYMRVERSFGARDTVSCCSRCNSFKSSYYFANIQDCAVYLQRKYETRYKKVLELPEWSDEEIKELRGSLKRRVIRNRYLQQLIKRKLENLEAVSSGFSAIEIDPIKRK